MIEEIIAKIVKATGETTEEIYRMIEDKQVEMSGLISEEGAVYLVAKELGVELRRETEKLNIENVSQGMQNADVTGKITRIFPVREFKTEKAEGRVANIIIADSTGSIRISLWNDEIEKLNDLSVGDIVRVRGFVRDNNGQPELRMGRKGNIIKLQDVEGFDTIVYERKAERSSITELREGFYRSLRAPILQIFDTNLFFEICPECRKRLKETETAFTCAEHGEVIPSYGMIISGIIDDSTGNIRAVFFTESAEKIIGMSVTEVKKLFDKKKKTEAIISQIPLGKEFIFEGSVRRNTFFDRLEFVVNDVKPMDVRKEIEMMMVK